MSSNSAYRKRQYRIKCRIDGIVAKPETNHQRELRKLRQARYAKTDRGRAVRARNQYERRKRRAADDPVKREYYERLESFNPKGRL